MFASELSRLMNASTSSCACQDRPQGLETKSDDCKMIRMDIRSFPGGTNDHHHIHHLSRSQRIESMFWGPLHSWRRSHHIITCEIFPSFHYHKEIQCSEQSKPALEFSFLVSHWMTLWCNLQILFSFFPIRIMRQI